MLLKIITRALGLLLGLALVAGPGQHAAVIPAEQGAGARSALAAQKPAAKRASGDVVPGMWVVAVDGPVDAGLRARLRDSGMSVKHVMRGNRGVVVTGSLSDVEARRRLSRIAGAGPVEPVRLIRAAVTPNDPQYPNQWGLPAIKAPIAWDTTTGASGVKIAIVDTGVDLSNVEFSGRLTAGYNFVSNNSVAQDDNGHGTHVAGIAAAAINNGVGGTGLAPTCSLMPVKVLDNSGVGYDYAIADGIRYAADNGAGVINMSLASTSWDSVIAAAVTYAQGKDVVLVAAAGNTGGSVSYPAALPGVVGVSAVDSSLSLASFSNRGPEIDVAAPGVSIVSTNLKTPGNTVDTTATSGTSMASPFVAATAALMRGANPALTQAEVVARLRTSADDLGATGFDNSFGAGLVNAARALTYAAPGTDGDIPGVSASTSPVTGTVDSSYDVNDVWAVSVLAGQSVSVTLTASAPNDFDLKVFGPSALHVATDTPVVADTGTSSRKHVTFFAGQAGVYYIDVFAASGAGAYTVDFSKALDDPADNDVPGVAITASPITGHLARDVDNDDVFRVSLAKGQRLTASLTGEAGSDFDLYLFPPSVSTVGSPSKPVAFSATSGYPETVSYTVLVPGTYYLDAYVYSGYGQYTVTWSVSSVSLGDDDDIPGVALSASPFSRTIDTATDTNDVYFVDLDTAQEMTASITGGASVDYDLYLYGPTATHIAPPDVPLVVSEGTSASEVITYTAPAAGRYYVDVRAYGGGGTYTLAWARGSGPADNGIPGAALPESPFQRLLGVGGDTDDVFDVVLAKDQQLNLSLDTTVTADINLYVYGPDATSLTSTDSVAASYWNGNPEHITFIAPVAGTYHIDVRAASGSGLYTLTHSVGGTAAQSQLSIAATQTPGAATVSLSATLTAGTPVAGVRVAFEKYVGGVWSPAGFGVTNANGAASYSPSVDTLRFRARYSGNGATAAATTPGLDIPDLRPPTINITGVTDGLETSKTVTPVVSITGSAASTVTLDGATFASGTPVSAEGTHTLVVQAQSAASVSASRTVTFTIDTASPVITITGVTDGLETSKTVTPVVSAVDTGAPVALDITLDDATFVSGTTVVADGAHTLVVTTRDTAGNSASRTVTFTIDTTAPVITITGVGSGTDSPTAVTPQVSVSGQQSFAITLNGVAFVSGTTISDEGDYTLVVTAVDRLGNLAERVVVFGVHFPPVAVATITSASTVVAFGSSAEITGTLVADGAPLVGRTLELWAGAAGAELAKTSQTAVTGPGGVFNFPVTPGVTTSYAVRFAGDVGALASALSNGVQVTPRAVVGTPAGVSAVYRTRSFTISGDLSPTQAAVPGAISIYMYFWDGSAWVPKGTVSAEVTTTPSSRYTARIALPIAGSWRLRAYYAGSPLIADAWSEYLAVAVRDTYVGNPVAPSHMHKPKAYTVYGTLKPAHSSYVRIYKWFRSNGRWVPKGYVLAKASSASTRYSAFMRLPYLGTWRLRAYHPVDSRYPAKWSSGYDYVSVVN